MKQKKRVKFLIYGCQMNVSDAERMEGQLSTIGYEPTEHMEKADLILINTCCVRETSEEKESKPYLWYYGMYGAKGRRGTHQACAPY